MITTSVILPTAGGPRQRRRGSTPAPVLTAPQGWRATPGTSGRRCVAWTRTTGSHRRPRTLSRRCRGWETVARSLALMQSSFPRALSSRALRAITNGSGESHFRFTASNTRPVSAPKMNQVKAAAARRRRPWHQKHNPLRKFQLMDPRRPSRFCPSSSACGSSSAGPSLMMTLLSPPQSLRPFEDLDLANPDSFPLPQMNGIQRTQSCPTNQSAALFSPLATLRLV